MTRVSSCGCLGVCGKWGLPASSSTVQVFLLSDWVLWIESCAVSLTVGIFKYCGHKTAAGHRCYVDRAEGHLKADHNPFCRGDIASATTTAADLGQHPCKWLWSKATVSWAVWWKITQTGTLCSRCFDKPQLWIWVWFHCIAHFGTVEPC